MGNKSEFHSPSLFSQHVSWISVDPILGCPASCSYCFLVPLKLVHKKPIRYTNLMPHEIYAQLQIFEFFDKLKFSCPIPFGNIPIAIGNYTDMCMTPGNRKFLLELLQEHERIMPHVPVCILTKAKLDPDFLQKLGKLNLQIIFFISLSFLSREFEQGTPSIETRLKNFKLITEHQNMKVIHWWRPITSINVPNRAAIEHQLDLLQEHDAKVSVIIGLAYGNKLSIVLEDSLNPLSDYFQEHKQENKGLIFEEWIRDSILDVAAARNYPVFTGTACAISFVQGMPCYRAGFRKPFWSQSCFSSSCPDLQKDRCREFAQTYPFPATNLINELANFLELSPDKLHYSDEDEVIIVQDELTQEELNYLTQATSFAITCGNLINNLEWQTSLSNRLRPKGS